MSHKPMILAVVVMSVVLGLVFVAGLLGLIWLGYTGRLPKPRRYSYWTNACVTADGKLLAAGGAGYAVIDAADGRWLATGPEDVHGVACGEKRAFVAGYTSLRVWPDGSASATTDSPGGRLVAALDDGTLVWTSFDRRSGKAVGPSRFTLQRGGGTRGLAPGPGSFGAVGGARTAPFADRFSSHPGTLLPGRRLLLAAGWQPNFSGSAVEPLPWGFFALGLDDGRVEALLPPTPSDARIRMTAFPAQVAGSADGRTLAVAVSNGTTGTLAIQHLPDGHGPRVALPGWVEIARLAVSPDGASVAVASSFRGAEGPAKLAVFDARDGRSVWARVVGESVYGLALLADGSLVWATSDLRAERLDPDSGRSLWSLGPQ